MIVLNEKIRHAIAKAIEEIGGQSELSRRTGISQQSFSKYISGYINQIGDRTWEALFPYIKKHLPSGYSSEFLVETKVKSSASVNAICRYALEILESPSIPQETKIQLLTLYFKEKI